MRNELLISEMSSTPSSPIQFEGSFYDLDNRHNRRTVSGVDGRRLRMLAHPLVDAKVLPIVRGDDPSPRRAGTLGVKSIANLVLRTGSTTRYVSHLGVIGRSITLLNRQGRDL